MLLFKATGWGFTLSEIEKSHILKITRRNMKNYIIIVHFEGVLLCVATFRMQRNATISEISFSNFVHSSDYFHGTHITHRKAIGSTEGQ
jgi:hypothetical protein